MSRIETLMSQDDLPPEILRRLQVEELWARRNVLAELMNAERLQVYAQRCTDLNAGCSPMDVGSRDRLARLAASVIPMRNRKSLASIPLSPGDGGFVSQKLANHWQVQ